MVPGKYFSVKEAAEYLKLSQDSIRRLMWQKRLARYKAGQRTLVLQKDVEALVVKSK